MKLKWIAIAGVALLVLAGGGGTYFFLLRGDSPAIEVIDVDVSYVELNALAVPIIRGNRVKRYLYLNLSIELSDEDYVEEIEERLPFLRDALTRELSRVPKTDDGRYERFDLAAAKARILAVARRIVGEGVITNILVTRMIKGAA